MNRMVAVQDCGLIIDLKTAESQVYGAMIMGVASSLFEERVMDDKTGKMLNANMEFYRLGGIGDVGEMQVHFMTGPGYDERGPVGLGEPPTVSPGAAISNAVANAIGGARADDSDHAAAGARRFGKERRQPWIVLNTPVQPLLSKPSGYSINPGARPKCLRAAAICSP